MVHRRGGARRRAARRTSVPLPTPPKVMPLSSLSAEIWPPPCQTRTYLRTPELSEASLPPYLPVGETVAPLHSGSAGHEGRLLASRPSMFLRPELVVGALPRRTSPPHLPRVSVFDVVPTALAVSVTPVASSETVGLIAVKVIGFSRVPSCESAGGGKGGVEPSGDSGRVGGSRVRAAGGRRRRRGARTASIFAPCSMTSTESLPSSSLGMA